MGKTMELRHNSYFFKACKHKINSVVRRITTLRNFFCMNSFILTDINNIHLQRHLVVIFYYLFLQTDRCFQCWWKIIIWIILLSLRIIGEGMLWCYAMKTTKNVFNVWFISGFKCRDVCKVAYITKKKLFILLWEIFGEYSQYIFIKVISFL